MGKKIVYPLMDFRLEKDRILISKFIMNQGHIPAYPGMVPDFFHTVDPSKGRIKEDSDNIIRRCDEVWVFGKKDKTMQEKVSIAIKFRKPIKYFEAEKDDSFKEIKQAT